MDSKDIARHRRFELTIRLRFSSTWEHRYVCEGSRGAVEFHASDYGALAARDDDQWSGGFEVHSATPTDDGPPDHGQCSALSTRPCWHDGSSLYASEHWIPIWRRDPNNHEMIFRMLAEEYDKRFPDSATEPNTAEGLSQPVT